MNQKRKRKWMIVVGVIVVLAAAVLLLRGFGEKTPKTVKTTQQLTYTDSLEREVTFNAPTQRVIALDNIEAKIVDALGVTPLAVTTHASLPQRSAEKWKALPQLSAQPNPAEIAALSPDIVVGPAAHVSPEWIASLTEDNVPVLFWKTESLADIENRIYFWGAVLGREPAAEKIVHSMETSIEKTRNAFASVPPKHVLIIDVNDNGVGACDSHTLIGNLAQLIPMVNLADELADVPRDREGLIPIENVIKANLQPQAVIVLREQDAASPGAAAWEELESSAYWQTLPALASGNVTMFTDDEISATVSVRAADAVALLAKTLYGPRDS